MKRLRRFSLTGRRTLSSAGGTADPAAVDVVAHRESDVTHHRRLLQQQQPMIESALSTEKSIGDGTRTVTSMGSSMSCCDTTTEETTTTSSHYQDDSDDDDDDDDDTEHEAVKRASDMSLIESIQQLDALLSGKKKSATIQDILAIPSCNDERTSQTSCDNRSDSEPFAQARRASTGGAVSLTRSTEEAEPMMVQSRRSRIMRRMSGGGFMRDETRTNRSIDVAAMQASSDDKEISSRGGNMFSPAKRALMSMRKKSFRAMRRYSVGYRHSSKHDNGINMFSNAEAGDPSTVQEIEFQPTQGEASESLNGRSEHLLESESHAGFDDMMNASPDDRPNFCHAMDSTSSGDDSDSDAASDAVQYNTDDEVYNSRRQAASPTRTPQSKPTPSKRVSLMDVMPRSSSPIRPRSVCSLPTPRNEFDLDVSEYDDETISTVSDSSDLGTTIFQFDDLDMDGGDHSASSCNSLSNQSRQRPGQAVHRRDNSFTSDVSSEVEESIMDSVVGRRHSMGRMVKRTAPRRSSLGTTNSESSEPDDSMADSLAKHRQPPRQIQKRRLPAPAAAEAIGWQPTFVSPINENRRRRLSLSNIPAALNDGSRGLPRFDSVRFMRSEESEDTFMLEHDDSSEA